MEVFREELSLRAVENSQNRTVQEVTPHRLHCAGLVGLALTVQLSGEAYSFKVPTADVAGRAPVYSHLLPDFRSSEITWARGKCVQSASGRVLHAPLGGGRAAGPSSRLSSSDSSVIPLVAQSRALPACLPHGELHSSALLVNPRASSQPRAASHERALKEEPVSDPSPVSDNHIRRQLHHLRMSSRRPGYYRAQGEPWTGQCRLLYILQSGACLWTAFLPESLEASLASCYWPRLCLPGSHPARTYTLRWRLPLSPCAAG